MKLLPPLLCVIQLNLLVWADFNVNANEKDVSPWYRIASPAPRLDSEWMVFDYLGDTKLYFTHLLHIDFETNGVAWLASSEGLFRYNGYVWDKFTEEHGLPSRFIRCVLVTRDQTLWVGTDKGAGTFDGIHFRRHDSEYGLAGPSVRRMVEDTDGTIWFCCDPWPDSTVTGGLSAYREGRWITYRTDEGLPSNHVMDYFRDSQNRQFVLTDAGFAVLSDQRWLNPLENTDIPGGRECMWDITEIAETGVMISSKEAIYLLHDHQWARIPINKIQAPRLCSTRDGKIITCLTNSTSQRNFQVWKGQEFLSLSTAFSGLPGDIECVREAPDGSIWAVGFNCLSRWERFNQRWVEFDALPLPRLIDQQNRIWFVGETTVVKDGENWFQVDSPARSYIVDASGEVWGWSDAHVIHCIDRDMRLFERDDVGLRKIQGLVSDPTGFIWAYGKDSEENDRIVCFNGEEWEEHIPADWIGNEILKSCSDPHNGVWFLSRNQKNHVIVVFLSRDESRKIPFDPTTPAEAVANFTVDGNGNIWIYGQKLLSIFKRENNPTQVWDHFHGIQDQTVFSVMVRGREEWIGLRGNILFPGGAALLDPFRDGWQFYVLDTREFGGKMVDETIYLAGYEAVFLIPPHWNHTPLQLSLPKQVAVQWILKESDGTLWIETEDAVLRYRPNEIPPETIVKTQIQRIVEGDTIRVECIGRSRFVPQSFHRQFLFSWQINNGAWNEFQILPPDGLPIAGLRPGRHVVRICARDEDFKVDPTPALLDFYVVPLSMLDTWWMKTIGVSMVGLVFAFATIAVVARRKLALYANNLETIVKERTQALRESEANYRELVQNTNSIILRMTPNGIITFINDFAQTFFGYSSDELLSRNVADAILPKNNTQIQSSVEANADSLFLLDHHTYFECENIAKNGDRVWVAWTRKAIVAPDGAIREILCVGSDITDHKKAEEKAKRLESQLYQAQKMEAIGHLAGGVAHDFNNLLTGIIGNINLAKSNVTGKTQKYLTVADQAANRAAELVRQLLAFSRKTPVQLKPVDVNKLVNEAFHLARETMDRRIEIIVKQRDNLPLIHADEMQIHTLLMNLCVNARDSIHEIVEGKVFPERRNDRFVIGLETDLITIDETFCKANPHARPGTFVTLCISDNGMGMTADVQTHIFEPFFTTKEVGKGTGLGLAGAYGIIDQHRGWIILQSKAGIGATFTIFLPIAELEKSSEIDPFHASQSIHLL
ncbi:MAG: PAS domain S-box protein [Candidatus Omnitrophota bacterium]|jgi:PAS domain S-box-containing protein|nr:MAG: PAS domain S-box protein [Candidatus Omnitrophota bacterium]